MLAIKSGKSKKSLLKDALFEVVYSPIYQFLSKAPSSEIFHLILFFLLTTYFFYFLERMAYCHLLLHKFEFFFLLPTVSVVFEIIPFAQFAPHIAIWHSLIFYMNVQEAGIHMQLRCPFNISRTGIFLKNDTFFAKIKFIYLIKYTFL